jgi:hypothetical protein
MVLGTRTVTLPEDDLFLADMNDLENQLTEQKKTIYSFTNNDLAPRGFGWCILAPNGRNLFTTLTDLSIPNFVETKDASALSAIIPYQGILRMTLNLTKLTNSTLYEFTKTSDIYGSADMWIPVSINHAFARHTFASRIGKCSPYGLSTSWDGTRFYTSFRQGCFNGPIDTSLSNPVMTLQTNDSSIIATLPFQQTIGKIAAYTITDTTYTYQESLSLTNPWKTQLVGATDSTVDPFGDQIVVARNPLTGKNWIATVGYSALMKSRFVVVFEEMTDMSKGYSILAVCAPDAKTAHPELYGKRLVLSSTCLLIYAGQDDFSYQCWDFDTTSDASSPTYQQFVRHPANDIKPPANFDFSQNEFGTSLIIHPSGLYVLVGAPHFTKGGILYLYRRNIVGISFENPIIFKIDSNSPLLSSNNVIGRYLCCDQAMNLISVSLNASSNSVTTLKCNNLSEIRGGIVLCTFDPSNSSLPLKWLNFDSSLNTDPTFFPCASDPLSSLVNPTQKWFQDPWIGANVGIANLGESGDNKYMMVNSSICNRCLQTYVFTI